MKNLKSFFSFLFKKRDIIKKIGGLLVEVIGSLAALIILGLVILSARLSMGPLNIDFLTPKVEEALYVSPGFKTSVGHTQLVWRDWNHPFEIELIDLQIQKDGNPEWLKIEHVGVSFLFTRFLRGEIALKHVRLYHPCIGLERGKTGKFSLGFEEYGSEEEFSFEELAPLLALGGGGSQVRPLNDLRKLSIIEASVVLQDAQTEKVWELPKVTFTLRRQYKGFTAALTFIPLQAPGQLTVQVSHTLGSPDVDLTLDFQHVSLQSLIKKDRLSLQKDNPDQITFDKAITFFQHWNAPLHGKANFVFVPETLQIEKGQGNIDFGEGTLDLSVANLRPLPVNAGNIAFTLSPHLIDITNVSLLSGDMLLQFLGKLSSRTTPLALTRLLEAGQDLEVRGKVEDLPLDHLGALWPQDLAIPAREWLTKNLRKGMITEAGFSLKGQGSEQGFHVDNLDGIIKGKDAEVTYLEGLPPVQHADANATFDKKGFDITVTAGNIKGIKAQEVRILIKDLDTDNEFFVLDAKGKGPLSDILTVLENKPFEYATYAEIDPAKIKGGSQFSFHLDFPLLRDLTFKHIKMAVKGTCKNTQFERRLTKDRMAYLTHGNFNIDLTQDRMHIQGPAVLNQLPSFIVYKHFFTPSSPHELQIQVEAQPSFVDFKRLGFDYTAYGEGPLKTHLVYTLERDKRRRLAVGFDATGASLKFQPLKWVKKGGEHASLFFTLLFDKEHLFRVTDISLRSSLYSLTGEANFDHKNDWKTIHLSQFKGPFTSVQATLRRPQDNRIDVSLKGKSLNIEEVLQYLDEEDTAKNYPPTDIRFAVNVRELRLGEGRAFRNVKAAADLFLEGKESSWKKGTLQASLNPYGGENSGGISFSIVPGSNQTQILTVYAADAGQFLRILGMYDNLQGGTLRVNAVRKPEGAYRGILKIESFDAHKVPLMARFAAILSPIGIINLFSEEESLSMESFKCKFTFDNKIILVEDGVGKSMSLGFTVKGKLDRAKRIYALQGNIIPARFINSVLNNIPIIGSLLSGGKGEGLFGMAYTILGSFDAPDISVNPLSMFAPGFLRNIFSSDIEEEQAP